MVNSEIKLIIFFAAKDGEALCSQQKQDQELTRSDHELLIAKCRLKLKKVGKTTRPFRYDLNQIPFGFTVEVTKRFKGLDLIECLKNNKLWKILKEMGIPDYLTCLLRNLYAGQEAAIRNGHRTMNWFQIGKGVHQGCIFSP